MVLRELSYLRLSLSCSFVFLIRFVWIKATFAKRTIGKSSIIIQVHSRTLPGV